MKRYQKIVRKAAALLVSLALVAVAVPASFTVAAAQRCEKKANGTFIQSWLCQNWSDAKWETELDYMDQAGMTYLIYADVAYRDSGTWTTKYPSQISGLAGTNNGLDVIENVLRNCARHNIKVFIGMGNYSEFEVNGGIGSTFTSFCNISAQIVAEIYNLYHSRYPDTFYGWYFVPEFNNNYLNMTPYVSKFASGMNVVINELNQLDPAMPLLLSPYFMKYYTTASVSSTKTFWTNMLTRINFRAGDILAPQDAVGAGWIEMSDLDSVTKMYRQAVDAANKGVILWSNCESFIQNHDSSLLGPPETENTTFVTSPLNRYVQQMTIVSQYVDNIIMFSYNHYYSPNQNDPVFNNTYLDYLANGALETQCPTAPTRISTALQSDGSLKIGWGGASDNIGIAAYRVLKNGSFMVRNDVSYGSGFTVCTDADFSTSGQTTYEIQAIDGAGNASGYAAIVVDGANPNGYVGGDSSSLYKCVAGIDNLAAGIRPGVNDPNGYFGSMTDNGTNYVIETADGVGYQSSRGLRYSVPSTAGADVWVSWKLLPPSYTVTSAHGADSFYYWVDTTNMGSNRLSHMVLISENDAAANETTVWTLKSTANLYLEDGTGGFYQIAGDNGNVKYPVGYKGFVRIPLTEFTPTYGTADSNAQWGLDSINYIQFAYNSYDEWKGCSAAFDSFGFLGSYTDGSPVPIEF